jgi:hypothetical protein
MGMVAFYAGLLVGTLVGVVLTLLLSKLVTRGDVSELPGPGSPSANRVELKTP